MSNQNLMSLNTNGYNKVVSTTSLSVQLSAEDAQLPCVIIDNTDSTWLFVQSSKGAGATVVFPVDGTTTQGKLCPPGASVSYQKNIGDDFLNMIRGTLANLARFSIGSGE